MAEAQAEGPGPQEEKGAEEFRQSTGLPPEPDNQMYRASELRREIVEALAKLLSLDGVISGRLDSLSYGCFIRASDLAGQFVHEKVGTPHLVAAFSLDSNGRRVLEQFGFKPDGVLKACIAALPERPRWLGDATEHHEPLYEEEVKAWVRAAADFANKTRRPENRTIEAEDFFRALSGAVTDPLLVTILKFLRGEPDPPLRSVVLHALARHQQTLERIDIALQDARAAAVQIVRHRRVSRRRSRALKSTILRAINGLQTRISSIEDAVLRSRTVPLPAVASAMTAAVLLGGLAGWLLQP